MSAATLFLPDVDAKGASVGRRLQGAVLPVPVGVTYMRMAIDRALMLDDDGSQVFFYGVDVSLDGGVTWGGTWMDTIDDPGFRQVKQHALTLSAGCSGERHRHPGILSEDAAFGFELGQPDNPNRVVRSWVRASRPTKCGQRIVVDDRKVEQIIKEVDHHSVAVDASSAAQEMFNVTSMTFSHTAAGANRYVRASAGWAKVGVTTITSTYGGTSMGEATGSVNSGAVWSGAVNGAAQVRGLIAPATGAQNIIITWSAGGNYGACGAVSYTGVHQTTASGTAVTASGADELSTTSNSLNVTSNSGDMVGSYIANSDSDATARNLTAGKTLRWKGDDTRGDPPGYLAGSQDAAGAASVDMSWTWAGDGLDSGFAHVAANILQADILMSQACL